MLLRQSIATLVMFFAAAGAYAQQSGSPVSPKVLLVYDKVDKGTQPYINAFRERLKASGLQVDETAVEIVAITDITPYRTILLYSRVMAFDNMSPVRDWLKKQQDLGGKNVFLFVTANRWLYANHYQKMLKIISDRKGTVVDAVTMATKSMNAAQKRDAVAKHLEKLK